jgi:hypothetical protein
MISKKDKIIFIGIAGAGALVLLLFAGRNEMIPPPPVASSAVATSSVLAVETPAVQISPVSSTPQVKKSVVAATVPSPAPLTPPTSPRPGKELGVWVWTPLSQMSATQMQQVVDAAAANHFTAIYITVDEYLFLAPRGGLPAVASYEQTVNQFISLAAQKNIAVDAEAGSRGWGQSGLSLQASAIITFVTNYNAIHTAKFRGVQFDIEPYLLSSYDADQAQILSNYVQLVSQLEPQAASAHLPLSIVVPYYFDDTAIINILKQSPGNRLIVMAYRNTAGGRGGSIALSQTEILQADATNVGVLVAQETGPVTPSIQTFNGLSKEALREQALLISSAFASNPSFRGIAIDYLDPFLQLP